MAAQDYCGACGRLVRDHDAGAVETADGQRYCALHVPLGRELPPEDGHRSYCGLPCTHAGICAPALGRR